MSEKLAISAAFSVLMMAGYVLLGADAVRAPIGPDAASAPIGVTASLLPSPSQILPAIR